MQITYAYTYMERPLGSALQFKHKGNGGCAYYSIRGECVDVRGLHAGSRREAPQPGNWTAAAARVPDERGVERAERGHGQHAAEAPVADGLERGTAGLAGTDDALAGGRRRQRPEDIDNATLRLVHHVQAVRGVVAAREWERKVGRFIGERKRESGLAAGERKRESGLAAEEWEWESGLAAGERKRESGLAGGEREREFGQSAATCCGLRRRRHGAIDDCGEAGEGGRGSCGGAEQ
jgi:hypothetical protein